MLQKCLTTTDSAGKELLRRSNKTEESFEVLDVGKIFLEHPLDLMGMYTRHLVSLMLPAYNQAYITNLYTDKGMLVIVSLVAWLLLGLNVFEKFDRKGFSKKYLWVAAVCLPCFLQLPGAAELRFFLPIYVMVYYYVFVVADYKVLWNLTCGHRTQIVFCMAFISMLMLSVYGDILAGNVERIMLIHDSYVAPAAK